MPEPVYNGGASGELQGSATALQLPDVPGRLAIIKARIDNVGRVYLGFNSSVTVPDGTTDVTSGLELEPGREIYLPIQNLKCLWRICDNAGDDLTYMMLG